MKHRIDERGAMTYPNTLIFIDMPSPDAEATAAFYAEVFNWEVEGRPAGKFHRIVPGGQFQLDDGSPSGGGHLHLGVYDVVDGPPHPNGYGRAPRPAGP